jgi:hypothetical protein
MGRLLPAAPLLNHHRLWEPAWPESVNSRSIRFLSDKKEGRASLGGGWGCPAFWGNLHWNHPAAMAAALRPAPVNPCQKYFPHPANMAVVTTQLKQLSTNNPEKYSAIIQHGTEKYIKNSIFLPKNCLYITCGSVGARHSTHLSNISNP